MNAHPARGQDTWIPGQYTGTCVVCRDGVITHTFTNQDGETVTI